MARGKKAHMTLTAAQHKALMKALGGEGLGDIHELSDVKLFVEPGHFGGEGWWSDLGSEVKKVAKRVQSNPMVREAEKKAVSYGAKTVRGVAEGALDGLGDTVATAIGIPEVAPALDAAIDRGASALHHRDDTLENIVPSEDGGDGSSFVDILGEDESCAWLYE